jgi:hypothetical protein
MSPLIVPDVGTAPSRQGVERIDGRIAHRVSPLAVLLLPPPIQTDIKIHRVLADITSPPVPLLMAGEQVASLFGFRCLAATWSLQCLGAVTVR